MTEATLAQTLANHIKGITRKWRFVPPPPKFFDDVRDLIGERTAMLALKAAACDAYIEWKRLEELANVDSDFAGSFFPPTTTEVDAAHAAFYGALASVIEAVQS